MEVAPLRSLRSLRSAQKLRFWLADAVGYHGAEITICMVFLWVAGGGALALNIFFCGSFPLAARRAALRAVPACVVRGVRGVLLRGAPLPATHIAPLPCIRLSPSFRGVGRRRPFLLGCSLPSLGAPRLFPSPSLCPTPLFSRAQCPAHPAPPHEGHTRGVPYPGRFLPRTAPPPALPSPMSLTICLVRGAPLAARPPHPPSSPASLTRRAFFLSVQS